MLLWINVKWFIFIFPSYQRLIPSYLIKWSAVSRLRSFKLYTFIMKMHYVGSDIELSKSEKYLFEMAPIPNRDALTNWIHQQLSLFPIHFISDLFNILFIFSVYSINKGKKSAKRCCMLILLPHLKWTIVMYHFSVSFST